MSKKVGGSTFLTIWQTAKQRYSIFLILLGMIAIASIVSPVFLSGRNITNIMRQMAVLSVISFGQTFVIAAGMIDLSVGSVMALAGMLSVAAFVMTESLPIALATALIVGAAAGLINGLVITKLKIPPFIATLGMLTAARGAALLYTGGQNIYNVGDFRAIARTDFLGLPAPIFYMLIGAGILWYIFNHTKLGRYVYAIGGNEEAARASGVKVDRVKVAASVVGGLFVGIAGVLYMSRVSAGLPNAGVGYELDTISIAVIGGTSITGGSGSAGGTLAGALIIGVLNNIMNLLGVQSYLQEVVRGAVIIIAVAYDTRVKARRKGVTKINNEGGGTKKKEALGEST